MLGTRDILRDFCLGAPLSCLMQGGTVRARHMGGRAGLCCAEHQGIEAGTTMCVDLETIFMLSKCYQLLVFSFAFQNCNLDQ